MYCENLPTKGDSPLMPSNLPEYTLVLLPTDTLSLGTLAPWLGSLVPLNGERSGGMKASVFSNQSHSQARDMEADDFAQLVARHYQALYKFALSLTRSEADACDLTQQTFYLWA